jgi:hypothetical protein
MCLGTLASSCCLLEHVQLAPDLLQLEFLDYAFFITAAR